MKLRYCALLAAGSLIIACGGDNDAPRPPPPPPENCAALGDEDQDGFADCADSQCASLFQCTCGNGVVDHPLENCDQTSLRGFSCTSLGYTQGGTLGCSTTCQLDLSTCIGVASADICFISGDEDADGASDCADSDCSSLFQCTCGNGVIDHAQEQCDQLDLLGHNCRSLGFTSGTLFCGPNCALDTSQCRHDPENCTISGDEDLDGFADCDDSDCANLFQCTCGDGRRNHALEDCDGTDLFFGSCGSLGYDAGILGCTLSCDYDTSGCYFLPRPEDCFDGRDNDFDGYTDCGDADCSSMWQCRCGDGVINHALEECDYYDFGFRSCASYGYDAGSLHCSSTCEVDTTGCYMIPDYENCNTPGDEDLNGWADCADAACASSFDCSCGNGNIDHSLEECDGWDLGGESCYSLGYDYGTLDCYSDCTFDTWSCYFDSGAGDGGIDTGGSTPYCYESCEPDCYNVWYDSDGDGYDDSYETYCDTVCHQVCT